MKLSASYNFFNGQEHLKASVASIRSSVDHISVVYQEVSNAGLPASRETLSLLHHLMEEKLIDEMYLYTPDPHLSRQHNELLKRRIGLELARKRKCTHFFTIDADEFYRKGELEYAKNYIEKTLVNSTSVSSFFHVKRPIYRALDITNCAFITEINYLTNISKYLYPVNNVDRTRRLFVFPRRHFHFGLGEVAMYHMNFVRKDLEDKLANTSTTNVEFLNKIRDAINNWVEGDTFLFEGKGVFKVVEVENEFNAWDPG